MTTRLRTLSGNRLGAPYDATVDATARLRIAFVTTRADEPGGSHVHLRDLACAMRDAGHEVTVFVGGHGEFTEQLAALGIAYHSLEHLIRPLRPLRDARAVLELRAQLRRLEPDLVHAHSSKAGWVARAAAWSLGIPAIFTAHGFAFSEGVPKRAATVYRIAERIAAPLATRIITVSEYDRQLALRSGVGAADQLIAIHNGIDDAAPALRAAPELSPPRIVMVARFADQKDHAQLFHALVGLPGDWHVDLLGDGPLRPAAELRIAELGLGGRVHVHGNRPDVATWLARSQVFALATKYEGLPLTILEAMRAGLPVVASAVGGVPETIVDGETGFLVPRGNADVFRERLARLVQSPALRVRMGAAARARFESAFSFDRMLAETLAVYYDSIPTSEAAIELVERPLTTPTSGVLVGEI